GQVSVALGMGAALILVGTLLFHHLMDWTYAESFYFAVVTLTTVGYGDLTPDTDLQRVVVAIYVLVGMTIFITAISIIGVNVIEKRQAKIAERFTERNEMLKVRVAQLEKRVDKFWAEHKSPKDDDEPSADELDVN
ncbi:MAG: two pore domain potassium channel family protein, partial [Gemmatimonadetes bacterium]|nr:two pore domain potassium channel family protein [Gemmatimonadota bacterium]